MGPYSLLSVGNPGSTIQAQDPFANFLIQPYQLNSGGNLPGNTDISVNGGVMISGATSSIVLNNSNSPTSSPSINISGPNDQILFTNPSSGIPNVVIGELPNSFGFGMLVSQPGQNVLTATASQLIFNSNQDIFKIALKGTTTIASFTINNASIKSQLTTIAHGLSITPVLVAYAQAVIYSYPSTFITTSYAPLPISGSWQTGVGGYLFPDASSNGYNIDLVAGVDSTNLYFNATYHNTTGSAVTLSAIPITYFCLQETAT